MAQLDPYAMAGCVIDEAIRNCVAVGADPSRIAILDNFCWGNTERPETLGSLVRAAEACRDVSLAYRTPFISGKDSLNNEYTHEGRSLAIPPTLLISAIGIVPDVRAAVTMDLKARRERALRARHDTPRAGRLALGRGQRPARRERAAGRPGARAGPVPRAPRGDRGWDWSGAATTSARAAWRWRWPRWRLAGGLGASVSLDRVPRDADDGDDAFVLLFSESPTRFVLEVAPEDCRRVEDALAILPARPGSARWRDRPASCTIAAGDGSTVVDASLDELKEAWQRPLRW